MTVLYSRSALNTVITVIEKLRSTPIVAIIAYNISHYTITYSSMSVM